MFYVFLCDASHCVQSVICAEFPNKKTIVKRESLFTFKTDTVKTCTVSCRLNFPLLTLFTKQETKSFYPHRLMNEYLIRCAIFYNLILSDR